MAWQGILGNYGTAGLTVSGDRSRGRGGARVELGGREGAAGAREGREGELVTVEVTAGAAGCTSRKEPGKAF